MMPRQGAHGHLNQVKWIILTHLHSPFFNEALPLTWEVKPYMENAETHKVHKDCILIWQIIDHNAADGMFCWWRILVVDDDDDDDDDAILDAKELWTTPASPQSLQHPR